MTRCRAAVWGLLAAAAAVLAAPAPGAAASGGVAAAAAEPPGKVLIVSMPRLVWQDIADQRPPHLMELLGQSAVASLSVRAIGPRTDLGEGYVTLGAGNRARVDRNRAGDAVDAGEQIGPNTGAAIYHALTGHDPADAAVLSLAIEDARADADHLLYGSVPGAMGKAIEDAGRSAAVIANADGGPPTGVEQLHREAALAMMDTEGRVGGGTVSRDLTVVDPAAPGGRRMDPAAVLDAFDAAWSGPNASDAVLVEMSDLERAERYGLPLTGPERAAGLASPLQQADAMLGQLLQRVDLARDRVIVVSPAAPGGYGRLTVFGLAGRGVEPGLARSATTRRDGYVTLPDVGATVLDSLGLQQPDSMNSTPITSSGGRRLDADLAADLAIADEVARFRDRTVGPVSVVYIVLQVVTYGLTALALLTHRRALQGVVGFAALVILATPPITFLAGLFRYDRLGLAPVVVAVFVAAAVLAGIAATTRRIHPFLPALALVGLNWLLQIVDIVLGGRLQLSTPLGYSPIVAGRFQGLGNLAFAVLAASAVVLATGPLSLRRREWPPDAALTEKTPRSFLIAAIAILTVTFIVDGYPTFGSDVGGVLATVPAFAVVVILLAGWRVSVPKLLAVGAGTVVAISALAALDLSRPADQRTHLGRFAHQLVKGEAGVTVHRKVQANLSILTSSVWTWLVPVCLAFVTFLLLRRTGYLHRLQRRVPGVRACLIGSLIVGILGFALNDSGVAIPAMMFGIVLPWVTWLLLRTEADRSGRERKSMAEPTERNEGMARAAEGGAGMSALVAFLLALGLAIGLWPLLRPTLSAPVFERENFRHRRIPVAAGLVIVLAVLLGALPYSLVVLWSDDGPLIGRSITTAALAAVGFGLFGLLDDLAGSTARRGYRGHVGALRQGELTTGLLKLVGGGLVAVVVAWPWAEGSLPDLVGAALVVALAANLGNLLDRAPGRVGKVSLLAIVGLAVTSHLAPELTGPALVGGAGVGMLWPDLRERCMLGDTGSNVLGAGAGLGVVATTSPATWWVAVVVLAALNLASEAVSFSDVIGRTPPLRWLDRLGAPPR